TMTRRATWVPLMFGVVLVLAACGGSGGTSPAASDAGGGTAPTTVPAATEASSAGATEAASSESGGGGSAGDFTGKVCDLISQDAMSAVTAVAADKQDEQPFLQGTGTCGYFGSGGTVPVAALTLVGGSTTDASVPWNIYKSDASSVSIPVTGAEAIWYGSANSAIVHKNGYLGTILLLAPKDGDFKGAASSLVQGLADKMP
ncbi:MAG TPA: hypothetical protein VMT36_05560, partial [Candidatus Saccharimonadia bacterium]|nr:hypothetical protein [Candidatus Saccharimonadia bacterium]